MILKSFIKDFYLVSLSQVLLTPYGTQTADLSDWSLGPYMRVQKNGLIRVTVTHQVRVRLSVLADDKRNKITAWLLPPRSDVRWKVRILKKAYG